MKLIEFLAELKQRTIVRRSPSNGNIGLYPNRTAPFPTILFIPRDTPDLHEANTVTVIKFQPRKLSSIVTAISRKKYTTMDSTQQEDHLYDFLSKIKQLDIDSQDLAWIENLPQNSASMTTLNGKPRIFKYVTTDLGQTMMVYKSILGDPPQDVGEEHYVPFHDARLFLPDTMKERSRTAAVNTLETVYQYLERYGEEEVFTGDIRFIRLSSRVAGLYDQDSGAIAISPNIKKSDWTIVSLLHEYGHKKMYEFMSKEEIKKVEEKFRELRKTGESHMGDLDYASALADATDKIKTGMKAEYVGRKKNRKKNPYYYVKNIEDYKGTPAVILANQGEKITSAISYIHNFINPKQWRVEGLDIAPPEQKSGHENKTDQWFPTEYSEKIWYEWWAELYALYTLGNLRGEPATWMKNMLGGKATETVGGNAGELNSEDDKPRPPPESRDEEGHAGWDWTDPYHSSGTTNAVLSGTP